MRILKERRRRPPPPLTARCIMAACFAACILCLYSYLFGVEDSKLTATFERYRPVQRLIKTGDLARAEQECFRLLNESPDDPDNQLAYKFTLGGVKVAKKDYETANNLNKEALVIARSNPLRYDKWIGLSELNLAALKALQGNSQEAQDAYAELIEKDPDSVSARYAVSQLAKSVYHTYSREEAARLLQDLRRRYPSTAAAQEAKQLLPWIQRDFAPIPADDGTGSSRLPRLTTLIGAGGAILALAAISTAVLLRRRTRGKHDCPTPP